MVNYPKKTLRIPEPHQGWASLSPEHDTSGVFDTGLCNRLFHWYKGWLINQQQPTPYTLCVEDIWYPETELIHFPDTVSINLNISREKWSESRKLFSKGCTTLETYDIDFNHGLEFEIEMFQKPLVDNHYFLEGKYTSLTVFGDDNFPFPKLEFKHKIFDEIINSFENHIGVHIRRGFGILDPTPTPFIFNEKSYLTSPEDYSIIEWKNNNLKDSNFGGKYIPNSYYFYHIEEILNKFPNKRIFISSDIPTSYLQPFFERYPNKIDTIDKYIPLVYKTLGESVGKFKNYPYIHVIKNVLDLFSLSKCHNKVLNNESSWSLFAKYYYEKI